MGISLRQKVMDLLVESCGIDRTRLEAVLNSPRVNGRNAGQMLVEEGLITQQDLLATLAKGLQLPPINLSRYKIDPQLAELVPERIARQ